MESMESSYADKEDGGTMDDNYIPNLTKLAKENIKNNTKHIKEFKKIYQKNIKDIKKLIKY